MNIVDRFAGLDVRGQRGLNTALLAIGVILVVLVPLALTVVLHGRRTDNEALRAATDSIADARDQIDKAKLERAATVERYARPAPPLAAFLAGLASESGIEIPESQDRQAVPHGKKYTERSTKIALHKVGMLKLAKFMERIEQAGNPIKVSWLNIRKRGLEPDSYDVEMIVSAFDRAAPVDKPKKAAAAPVPSAEEAKP